MPKNLLFAVATLTVLQFSVIGSRADSDASNLVANPGFEEADATSTYYLGVAGDSKDMKCRFSIDKKTFHSGAQSALMQADDFARFSIGPKVPCHPLSGGDHYRVGVWVKPGSDFQTQPGTPGVVLRMNPASGFPPVAASSLIFVNLDKTVTVGIFPPTSMKPLPADWTHLEAVIEIPAGVDSMGPVLYMWKAKGSLYVDDFTFEKVDSSVPLTSVVPGPTSP